MIIDCAQYRDGARVPGRLSLDEVGAACQAPGSFVWIGLVDPQEDEFDAVQKVFGLHDLAVEDAVHAHQRPKLETYGDSLFVVLKTARYVDEEEAIEQGEIQVFVGGGFVVHVRHGQASPLGAVRRRIESRPDLLRWGPSAVLYAIVDHVVDGYHPVMEGIDNDIREVEFQVFSEADVNPVERIYKLKREVLELHAATAPLLEPLDWLSHRHYPVVEDGTREYFRDAHDHLLKVLTQIVTARDLLTSVLEANLTRVSVRQNEDMRKISAWVAIAAVPTMIAGIYGMNFQHMPELQSTWGYPIILVFIALACGALYRGFRRSGWL